MDLLQLHKEQQIDKHIKTFFLALSSYFCKENQMYTEKKSLKFHFKIANKFH